MLPDRIITLLVVERDNFDIDSHFLFLDTRVNDDVPGCWY